ncbi:MAG: DUF481 domain-containing protein [Bacteroidota bacterium]|nr:DUF481 domain-containing protein [Bacteroidota bacterium]MDX5448930.1 DUF481 domain-containing protein [Bacteroidota bacterium]
MFQIRTILLVLIFFLSPFAGASQDSVAIHNGPVITGEIKGMDKGVLTLDADFGDSDLKIKWEHVDWIRSSTYFILWTSEGQRIYGKIDRSELGPGNLSSGPLDNRITHPMEKVVRLEQIKRDFWSRLDASIDLGFTLTKANDQRQFSLRGNLGYRARDWSFLSRFEGVQTDRNDAERVRRATWSNIFKRTIVNDIYGFASVEFFTSDEQQLDLRATSVIGAGNYFVYNSNYLFSGNLGLANNQESYQPEAMSDNRNSWEGLIGLDFSAYGLDDLSINTSVDFYPGLTEQGRYRLNFQFDLKYDLPRDFYIKLGYSHNYDNRPPLGGDENDYVATTGFGWEW